MFRQTNGMTDRQRRSGDQESSDELKEKCQSFSSDPQGSAFLKLPFSCLEVVILDTGHHLFYIPPLFDLKIPNFKLVQHNSYFFIQLNADSLYPFACLSLYLICLLIRMLIILILIKSRSMLIVCWLGDQQLIKKWSTRYSVCCRITSEIILQQSREQVLYFYSTTATK